MITAFRFEKLSGGSVLNRQSGKFTVFQHINDKGSLFTHDGDVEVEISFTNDGYIIGSGHFQGHITGKGSIHPGNSAGVLSIDGNFGHGGGGKEIELGGMFDGGGDRAQTEYDWIDVTGDIELASALHVELINGFELQPGNIFTFLRVGGTLTGEYDGLGEGALVGGFGGEDLFITYAGGDGNDVALFTVPEPTMALTQSMLIGLRIMMRRSNFSDSTNGASQSKGHAGLRRRD